MTRQFICFDFGPCCHFLVWMAVVQICNTAATVSSANTGITLTSVLGKLATTVVPVKAAGKVPTDYDYIDIGKLSGNTSPETKNSVTEGAAATLSQLVGATKQHQLPSTVNWKPLPDGLKGLLGERYEWLRAKVRKLQKHGLKDQLDALQEKHPLVNLTLLYDFFNQGYGVYDMEDSKYQYLNGSYHWKPVYDGDGGYWHNGTYIPGTKGGTDKEGGYFYNGTWYGGERDMEDGYYHNGTYYPGEDERPEGGTAYYGNETYGLGYDQKSYGQEDADEEEDLMWWQLHHPKWRDGGINRVDNNKNKEQPAHNQQQQQQPPLRQLDGRPLPGGIKQTQEQSHPRQLAQQRPGVSPPPQMLPMTQQRPPPKTSVPRPHSPNNPPSAPSQTKTGGTADQQSLPAKSGLLPTDNTNSGAGTNSERPGNAPLTGSDTQQEHSNPSNASTISPAVSWGIVLATILGVCVVLAPAACLLYKYREARRIKKRTFLRRPEHGSVDDGIMDALVMKDLGEKKDSRIKIIDKPGAGNRKHQKRREKHSRRGNAEKSTHRTTYELQPIQNRTAYVNIHEEPRDNIT